jgi:tRNA U34 2-thiouridine synthase MnmA/TrmU
MFSGGLDSVVAAHLLKSQGLEVVALHFVLPFQSGVGFDHAPVRRAAEALGVALRIEEEGEEFLAVLRSPEFGFGKNVNPCVDCRIHRIRKAEAIMRDIGASFIATGEVVGQRPMSQRKNTMGAIANRAGCNGCLLRPLSAKLLAPTVPEIEGWVDREKLFAISGRGRSEQLAYARRHGLVHGTPGGGCLLTEKEVAQRYRDLESHEADFDIHDFKLLAYGRHFRIGDRTRLIVGRNHGENLILGALALSDDISVRMHEIEGPFGLVRGKAHDGALRQAAAIIARYSKQRDNDTAAVRIMRGGETGVVHIQPADPRTCDLHRI